MGVGWLAFTLIPDISSQLPIGNIERLLNYGDTASFSGVEIQASQVVNEFVRRQKAKEFGSLIMEGAFDYPCSPEEIQELDR